MCATPPVITLLNSPLHIGVSSQHLNEETNGMNWKRKLMKMEMCVSGGRVCKCKTPRCRRLFFWPGQKKTKRCVVRCKTYVNHLIISDRHSVRLNNFFLLPVLKKSFPHQISTLFVCVCLFVLNLTALAPAQHRYTAIIATSLRRNVHQPH